MSIVPQLQHTKNIDAIVYSPDGTLALTTGDATIKLWDTSTLTLLRTLKGHTADIESVAFLPDGRRALSASQDHTLKLWDTTTGAVLGTYAGHQAWITSLALSTDGRRAVAGDLDGTLKLWEIADGLEPRGDPGALRSIDAHPEGNVRVAISPDGKTIASTGADHVVKLWDVANAKLVRTLTDERSKKAVLTLKSGPGRTVSASRETGQLERIVDLVFSPDGRRLLSASESGISVWDVAKGTRLRRIGAEHALSTVFFKDGKRILVAASYGNGLTEWDTQTGAKTKTFPAVKDEAFLSVALSPDERRAISGSSTGEGQVLRLWNEATSEMLVSKSNGETSVWSAAFSPDGRRAVSACGDGTIRIWDTRAARLERTITARDLMPSSVAVSPNGRHILSSGWDKNVRAWDIETGALAIDYTGEDPESYVDVVAYSPDGRRVVANMSNDLMVWDAAGGDPIHVLKGHSDEVHAVAFLPDGKRLVSASQDGTLMLWDVEAGKLIETFGEESANYSFFAVAAAPDGRHIAGAGRKGAIYIWDIEKADKPTIIPNAHPSIIDAIAYSPDGKRILTGAEDFRMKLWNVEKEKLERVFVGHENQVNTVAFSPDGLYGLTSSYDEATRLWRLDDGYSMAMVANADSWLAYTTDGYFDASRRGGDLVAAVQNNHAFRIDQLAIANNRPDRMMAEMGFDDDDVTAYYRARFERRVRKLGLSEDRLSTSFEKAPTARFASTKNENGVAEVTFDVSDPDGKLFRYNVYVNDVPLLGATGKPITGAKQHLTERVELGEGHNKIEIGVLNESGAEALRPFVVIDEKSRPKGDLYFLGFGVSHYKNPQYDLNYSHKDVLDLAEVLKTKHDAFREVHVSTYVNEEATVANVRKAKEFLRAAKTDDTVVLFVSGHGVHSKSGEYYYATHEVDPKRLPETAANFDLVEELLQGIAPRKKLFLMDTCESGERDDTDAPTASAGPNQKGLRARSTNAIAHDAAPASASKPGKPLVFDRERYIENDLSRRSGAIVLSSSRGSESSFELDSLQNGVFTESILKALTSDVADADHDGAVSTDELRVYVAKEVGRLTSDKQHPTVDRDNLDMKFGLPVIASAQSIQTRADPLNLQPRPQAVVSATAAPPIAMRPPQGCGCLTVPTDRSMTGTVLTLGVVASLVLRRRHRRPRTCGAKEGT